MTLTQNELIKEARKAMENAYAPYSGFKVGAALLTKSGNLYTGTNVENSSYGLSVCAERIAVFKAVCQGEKEFASIAIVSSGSGFVYPCGACLQVLAEFSWDIKVIVTDQKDNTREFKLGDMLPQAFSMDKQEG